MASRAPRARRDGVIRRATTADDGGRRDGSVPITARRHPLVAAVATWLRTRCDVAPGSAMLVAVSGGADSLALLTACVILARRGELGPLLAAHVHHHLRAAADADAAHVAETCRRLGVALVTMHIRPGEARGSLAANARRMRYAALVRLARRRGIGSIAVAHHADDQLETILMALGRGAGLDGLAGMAWSRPLATGVRLVRPLLAARKAQAESLCRAASIEWREDATNRDPRTRRGRLRRDVLPVFEELWPGAAARAVAAGAIIAAARDAVEERLSPAFGEPADRAWERARLASLPAPLIALGLRRAAARAAPACADALGFETLMRAADAIRDGSRRAREFAWPAGLRLVVRSRRVELLRRVRRAGHG